MYCGALVCEECLVKVNGKNYCKECVIKINNQAVTNSTNNNINTTICSKESLILGIVGIVLSISLLVSAYTAGNQFGNVADNKLLSVQRSTLNSSLAAVIPAIIFIISSTLSIFKNKKGSKKKSVIVLNIIAIIIFGLLYAFLKDLETIDQGATINLFILFRIIIISVVTFVSAVK